jgi:squalene-hopene/tetraprenyl-beta-curcumene cyclase
VQGRVGFRQAIRKGLDYLVHAQRQDGCWVPLWFGNQSAPNQENPVYGTAKVLTALHQSFDRLRTPLPSEFAYMPMLEKAARWLLSAQNSDGGWGGDKSVASSIEETALAVDALAESFLRQAQDTVLSLNGGASGAGQASLSSQVIQSAVSRGVSWLIEHTGKGTSVEPSPIGLYFAKLWYFEDLYPVIFTVSALQKVKNLCGRIRRTGQPRRS